MSKFMFQINIENTYVELIYFVLNSRKMYIIDFEQFNKINKFDKRFILKDLDDYPSYYYNYKKYNLINFLFNIKYENIYINFKNNNKYDLRTNNIEYYHNYHRIIIEKYPNAIYNQGHFSNSGKDSYTMKNPYWEIEIKDSNKIYLMYCETDSLIKIDNIALQKILEFEKKNDNKKNTFYKHSNGYILSSNKNLFIHQIITGCYGNGKGTSNISVDHIDQDPLNNCFNNLIIVDRKTQEQNTKGIK